MNRTGKFFTSMYQTATEIVSIAVKGKYWCVLVQTAEGFSRCTWEKYSKAALTQVSWSSGWTLKVLKGDKARKAIKPYQKRINKSVRFERWKKRTKEQERRKRLKGALPA